MQTATSRLLTHEEYFQLEQQQDQRYDYLAGEVFAMAGGSERHALISMNTGAALVNATRDRPCRVYGADMKLYIPAYDHYCYPDLMLLCETGRRHEFHVEAPNLIVEVLSATTASYDRGTKFEHYRSIDSLLYFLLLDQDRPHAELFERLPEGGWKLTEASGADSEVYLARLGIGLPLDELYRQVEWDPTNASSPPPDMPAANG